MSKQQTCPECHSVFSGPDSNINENLCDDCDRKRFGDRDDLIEKQDTELTQLRADKAELAHGLKCLEIGACAVGVRHPGEFRVLQDGVNVARVILELHKSTPDLNIGRVRKIDAMAAKVAEAGDKPNSIPPIVQELEQADDLDAAEDVLAENMAACDAGKVEMLVGFKPVSKVATPIDYAKSPPTLTLEFDVREWPDSLWLKIKNLCTMHDKLWTWTVDCWCTELPAEPEVGRMTPVWELDNFLILEPGFDDPDVGAAVSNLLQEWLEERVASEPVE